MPSRTQFIKFLPWTGGLNSSNDEGAIPAGDLVIQDNIVIGANDSKKSRESIDHNFDNVANGALTVVGQHDYWFGSAGSKTQRRMRVMSDGTIRSETGGTTTALTVNGKAWSGTLTSASMVTFNEKLIIAVTGSTNVVKYWTGSGAVEDLPGGLGQASAARSSATTTRTIRLGTSFLGVVGDYVIVSGMGAASYNGTFEVLTITTGSVTNDTITYTAGTSVNEGNTADTAGTITLVAPRASILGEHLGRIWSNDKTNNDRLHFCETFNHIKWLGYGDSGAIDIAPGDGDPKGIVGFKSFQGDMHVGKSRKLYRVVGTAPELFNVVLSSDGIGFVSHDAVCTVDDAACVFVSEKGVHDLATTDTYGSFATTYLSYDIQNTFNDDWAKSRQANIKAVYLDTINCVVVAVTNEANEPRVNTTAAINNTLYFYNVPKKKWYRWSDLSCQSLLLANDSDKKRLYLGTHYSRVSKTFTGDTSDVSKTGTDTQIKYKLHTGRFYPAGDPYRRVGFKRFIIYYRPRGTNNITVNVKIDDQRLAPENSFNFNESSGGTPLGTGFTLGSTPLGSSRSMTYFSRPLTGIGSGCKVEIEQTATAGEAEIIGFAIEFEDAQYKAEAS